MLKRNIRTLGPKGAELIHALVQKNKMLFTIAEAMKVTGNSYNATEGLIRHLRDKNWLMSIKNGKYVIVPLEAGMDDFNSYNWFVIARELIGKENYYISHYSAMSIHNMITQPLSIVYVVSPVRHREKKVGIIRFKFVYTEKQKIWGTASEWVTPQERVQVSNIERTIIDCLHIPEYCGGISEIAKGIWMSRDNIDYKKLYSYTNKFKKIVVSKRLGFILETYGINKENIITLLNKDVKKHESYPLLDPVLPDAGKYNKNWHLRINLNPEELKAIIQT
ncbi:MAG: type IV toxin-antitoxin system AbiEi family antitoxin [bacterium]